MLNEVLKFYNENLDIHDVIDIKWLEKFYFVSAGVHVFAMFILLYLNYLLLVTTKGTFEYDILVLSLIMYTFILPIISKWLVRYADRNLNEMISNHIQYDVTEKNRFKLLNEFQSVKLNGFLINRGFDEQESKLLLATHLTSKLHLKSTIEYKKDNFLKYIFVSVLSGLVSAYMAILVSSTNKISEMIKLVHNSFELQLAILLVVLFILFIIKLLESTYNHLMEGYILLQIEKKHSKEQRLIELLSYI